MPAYFAQMSSGDVWGRDGVAVVEVLTLFWTSSGASGAGGGGELHYLNARLAVQTCPAASDPRVGWGALKLLRGTSQALNSAFSDMHQQKRVWEGGSRDSSLICGTCLELSVIV